VTVRRVPGKPIPKVRQVRAEHRGSSVVVSWRTDIDASSDGLLVIGSTERSLSPEGVVSGSESHRMSRRRFTATARCGKGALRDHLRRQRGLRARPSHDREGPLMRRLALAGALLAFAPATASAASFAETPFHAIAAGASCLRATGAPGELAAWAPSGARGLHATTSGLADAGTIPLGSVFACPQVVAQPNGAGIAAASVAGGIAVALREPGGGWGVPLAIRAGRGVTDFSAAISERGDAVVAWREFGDVGMSVRAVRRSPGGAFGAPETLASNADDDFSTEVRAGIGADGVAIVAWSHSPRRNGPARYEMFAALASPGAGFAAPQRLARAGVGAPSLAVAPDGRALVAFSGQDGIYVAERVPGAGFAAPRLVAGGSPFTGLIGGSLALALRADGAAVVASGGKDFDPLVYVRRPAGGDFGPPLQAAEPDDDLDDETVGGADSGGTFSVPTAGTRPVDGAGADLRAVLAADDRVLFTSRSRSGRRGVAGARAVVVAPDGIASTTALGGPLRDLDSVAPLLLAGGGLAAAWADNAQQGTGRLHLVAEGVLPPLPLRSPRVRIGRPAKTVVPYRGLLVVPVTCSVACDLRVQLSTGASTTVSLARGGTVRLRLGDSEHPAAPRHGGMVTITVASTAPGAHTVRTDTLRLHLRRPAPPPEPRIFGLTARRDGRGVLVRWSTDRSARGYSFQVLASTADGQASAIGERRGTTRTSYQVRLRLARGMSRVRLQLRHEDYAVRTLRARVR
jgi:hypothetical protein